MQIMATSGVEADKIRILFVCLGNICRSPSAEAVFKDVVKRANLEHKFLIDSCGLGGGNEEWFKEGGWAYHEGHRADERMRDTALLRKIELTSLSRPLKPEDLSSYEYILGMDFANMAEIQLAADHWAEKFSVPSNYRNKLKLMCSFLPEDSKFKGKYMEVPDPYFDDDQARKGFHLVLDLLDDACKGLLDAVVREHNLSLTGSQQ